MVAIGDTMALGRIIQLLIPLFMVEVPIMLVEVAIDDAMALGRIIQCSCHSCQFHCWHKYLLHDGLEIKLEAIHEALQHHCHLCDVLKGNR